MIIKNIKKPSIHKELLGFSFSSGAREGTRTPMVAR